MTSKHYSLTSKQLAILNLLYRFRFITSDRLSKTLNISKSTTNKRLQLLLELNYIGRLHKPEDRILHKHAAYYLLPGGIAELKKISQDKYLPKVLRNIRNDAKASDQFVDHNLAVHDVYYALRSEYGDKLQFFTSPQMAAVSYFPKQTPDAHIQLGRDNPSLFLLDVLHQDQPFFKATRAIFRYVKYASQDEWPNQYEFPKTLLVCDGLALKKRLIKKLQYALENLDDTRLQFFITTQDDLKNDKWNSMAEPEEILSLSQI